MWIRTWIYSAYTAGRTSQAIDWRFEEEHKDPGGRGARHAAHAIRAQQQEKRC